MRNATLAIFVVACIFGCQKPAETPTPVSENEAVTAPVGEKAAPPEVAKPIRPPPPRPEEIARAAEQQALEKAAAENAARDADAAKEKANEVRRLEAEALAEKQRLEEEALEKRRLEERWGKLSAHEEPLARYAVAIVMSSSDDDSLGFPFREVRWCYDAGLFGKECREKLQRVGFNMQRNNGLYEIVNKGIDRQSQLRIAERWSVMTHEEYMFGLQLAVGFLKGFSLDTPYSNVIQLFQSGVFGEELRRRMEAHLRDKGAARLASLEEEEELDRKKLKQAKRSLDANDLRGAEKCLKEIVGERRWSPATKAGQEAWDLLPKVREMAEAQEEKARSDAQKSEREAYRKARVPAVRKSLLSLAKKFLDANDLAVAKRRLNEIIKEYPDTDEAKEAAKLLRELEGESQERE